MSKLPVVKMAWAQSVNRAIGKDNEIPWKLSEDLKHFQELTHGSTVIMGKNTWISLPEKSRPLPGRRNIILTRNPDSFEHEGAECFPDLETALRALPSNEVVWIVGGVGVYQAGFKYASEIHVTAIDLVIEDADTYMTIIPPDFIAEVAGDWQTSTNGIRYSFNRFVRTTD